MNMIFLGPPGAGKGTQAKMVCQQLNIPQISTGDMLRAAIKAETKVGLEAQGYINQGQLVPDEVVIAIVKERLEASDCQNGYLLDGFPRTVAQAEALATFADIDCVVNIAVPDESLIARLSGRRVCLTCGAPYHVDTLNGETKCAVDGTELIQRDDDNAETVASRLRVYHEKTAPLIAYYEKAGLLKSVDGEGAPKDISQVILTALKGVK